MAATHETRQSKGYINRRTALRRGVAIGTAAISWLLPFQFIATDQGFRRVSAQTHLCIDVQCSGNNQYAGCSFYDCVLVCACCDPGTRRGAAIQYNHCYGRCTDSATYVDYTVDCTYSPYQSGCGACVIDACDFCYQCQEFITYC